MQLIRDNCLSREMLQDMKAITTSQKALSPQSLAKFMQQRSFQNLDLKMRANEKKTPTNRQRL